LEVRLLDQIFLSLYHSTLSVGPIIDPVIRDIQGWIESFIIGLNICPFASDMADKTLYVHHKETHPITIANQIFDVAHQLRYGHPYETAFVIMPKTNMLFEDFYELTEVLQEQVDKKWPDKYVLVSFHPNFQYEGEKEDSTLNAVNRSPHPMIHILASDSLDLVAEDPAVAEEITQANIKKLKKLSWQALYTRYGVKLHQRF